MMMAPVRHLHPQIPNWETRLAAYTGVKLTDLTAAANNEWCVAGAVGSWFSKMLDVNTIPNDHLNIAAVPLIRGGVAASWALINFVGADLTVNGLKGNGSTKYADSKFDASTGGMTQGSGGIVVYIATFVSSTGTVCGANRVATATHGINCHLPYTDNNFYCDIWDRAVAVIVSNPGFSGYACLTRISTTDNRCFKASSVVAHTQTGSTIGTTVTSNPPDRFLAWWAIRQSTVNSYHAGRFSFCAAHSGLTGSESSSLFNAVQRLRTQLGGGYV